jgi:AmmeMemoRadiSam system protein B
MKCLAALKLPLSLLVIFSVMTTFKNSFAQIPMKRVLSRVEVPAKGDLRGLVDTIGFPHTAKQMDFIAGYTLKKEQKRFFENDKKYGFSENTPFVFGISPHDDYTLAARTAVHVQRHIHAKTVILIGNAHWSETFGIRDKLIFGDFKFWRGPYGDVKVSPLREEIIAGLPKSDYVVNRTVVETEHSLEALVPFLQYFNREVEIVPILIPFTHWSRMNMLAKDLAGVVEKLIKEKGLVLGKDVAVLVSSDGMHYGDHAWSYYNYYPFGTDASGYQKAMDYDSALVSRFLTGKITLEKDHVLYDSLINEQDISQYKVSWCGRFSVTFAVNFMVRLVQRLQQREMTGYFLRHGSSLNDAWVPVRKMHMGITGDVNLHHFVTYFSVGFK